MTSLLRAHNLGKTFSQPNGGLFAVFEKIGFDLSSGEIVCLLGASGSGKTTLLKVLSGLDVLHEGQIETDIIRPGNQVGYLSQNDRLLPWRSAAANVALGLELLGKNKDTAYQLALTALQEVGLANFAEHYPSQLSGGMQQRVLLARTLALKPKLLLLDEPMSNLDVLARRELSTLIKNYTRGQNAATLVVTHSVEEACFLADRIILITRCPGRLFKEIRLGDDECSDGTLDRASALDVVMKSLWQALEMQP